MIRHLVVSTSHNSVFRKGIYGGHTLFQSLFDLLLTSGFLYGSCKGVFFSLFGDDYDTVKVAEDNVARSYGNASEFDGHTVVNDFTARSLVLCIGPL